MPFCPQCGFEYQEGAEVCPDCRQPLVAEAPKETHPTAAGWPGAARPAPELSDEPLAVVYESQDATLADGVQQALKDAGIPVFEQRDRSAAYDGLDLSMVGRLSRVVTFESRAEEAKRIVADFVLAYQGGELALSQEEIERISPEPEPAPVAAVPHRGRLILILGILSLALFPVGLRIGASLLGREGTILLGLVLGIIAWVMAASDLADMRAGTRDARGRRLTNAGRVCGMIAVMATLAYAVFVLLWLLVAMVMGAPK